MADKKEAPPTAVKARVLCDYGDWRVDDVVTLDWTEAPHYAAIGVIDPHPDAVAHAERLPQNA